MADEPPNGAGAPTSGEEPAGGTRQGAKEAARRATRASMIEAATRMLLENPGADPLTSLRATDVAARAEPPRTTGAFYNIWPTQADFRSDLLEHVLSLERFQVGERTTAAIAASVVAEPFDLAEVVRLAANLNAEGLRTDPAMRLKQSLWSRYAVDDDVRTGLAGFYTAISQSLCPLYEAVLARSGRRMRPEYDVDVLAVALASLVEGLTLRRAVQPEAVPDDVPPPPGVPLGSAAHDRPWSQFAALAYTILLAMSEPDPSA